MRTTGARIPSAFDAANDHSATTLRMLSDISTRSITIFAAVWPLFELFFVALLLSFKFPNCTGVSR